MTRPLLPPLSPDDVEITSGAYRTRVRVLGPAEVSLDGQTRPYTWTHDGVGVGTLILDGNIYRVELPSASGEHSDSLILSVNGQRCQLELSDLRSVLLKELSAGAGARSTTGVVRAPMPGLVVRIEVKQGDRVVKGQGIVVLEAMKMENELRADRAGLVQRIQVKERTPVEKGQELLTILGDS